LSLSSNATSVLASIAIGSAAGFRPIDFDVVGIEALCF